MRVRQRETAVPIYINNVFECRQTSVRSTEVDEDLDAVIVLLYTASELQRGGASYLSRASYAMLLSFRLRRRERTFVLANCNLILIMVGKLGFPL